MINADLGQANYAPLFKKGRGFTLIELLVVIVIISIVGSFAVLTITVNQNKRLETLANQLANILTLAQQEALLRPATLGFVLTKTNYQFYEYRIPKKPDDNPWLAITSSVLGSHPIPNDVQVTLKTQNPKNSTPQLIIAPGADITPFKIFIGKKGASPRYRVTGQANGTITSEAIDEEK